MSDRTEITALMGDAGSSPNGRVAILDAAEQDGVYVSDGAKRHSTAESLIYILACAASGCGACERATAPILVRAPGAVSAGTAEPGAQQHRPDHGAAEDLLRPRPINRPARRRDRVLVSGRERQPCPTYS